MLDTLNHMFSSEGFMPHGHYYLWTPSLLWTYVLSDSVIGLAYYSIPAALSYFVHTDIQFNWIFKLFSMFIFFCGTTHLLSVWTIWHPDYWLDAGARGGNRDRFGHHRHPAVAADPESAEGAEHRAVA